MEDTTISAGISGGVTAPSDKDFVLIGTSGADSTIFNARAKNRHFYFNDRGGADTKIIGITFYRGKRSTGYGGGSISIRGSARRCNLSIVFLIVTE